MQESGLKHRVVAAIVLVIAAAAPFAVFHSLIADSASELHMSFLYFVSNWTAWLCVTLAVCCFVPVVVSVRRDPYSRWFIRPTTRRAYEIWGATLYLLGIILAVQMSQTASLL